LRPRSADPPRTLCHPRHCEDLVFFAEARTGDRCALAPCPCRGSRPEETGGFGATLSEAPSRPMWVGYVYHTVRRGESPIESLSGVDGRSTGRIDRSRQLNTRRARHRSKGCYGGQARRADLPSRFDAATAGRLIIRLRPVGLRRTGPSVGPGPQEREPCGAASHALQFNHTPPVAMPRLRAGED